MSDGSKKDFGAGRMILLLMTTAALLLWFDEWGHSLPVMIVTSVVALVAFLGFRNAKPRRELTRFEQIEIERRAAHRWMARNGMSAEDEARDNRSRLKLIDGGKEAPEE